MEQQGNKVRLNAEQILQEQVKLLAARLAESEARAAQFEAAASVLAKMLMEAEAPPPNDGEKAELRSVAGGKA